MVREAMVCSAMMVCAATTTGSMPSCGRAACEPLPVISIVNLSHAASIGPAQIANLPSSWLGEVCMPNTCWMPNRSISPSSTMASPPVRPSSLGWKTTTTVPSKLRVSHRYLAAPSSIAVCPSWPQACILPGVLEA